MFIIPRIFSIIPEKEVIILNVFIFLIVSCWKSKKKQFVNIKMFIVSEIISNKIKIIKRINVIIRKCLHILFKSKFKKCLFLIILQF